MEEDMAVYQEKVKLPLFHAYYDIIIGTDMLTAKLHAEDQHPGLELDKGIGISTPGYTYVINHMELGTQLTVLISLQELDIPDGPDLASTIVHEACHLSWYVMDGLGIKVNADNHEIQCYLIEQIVREINRVVDIAREHLSDNPLDDL